MQLNTKLNKGNWIDWDDGVRFLLRPYPVSQIKLSDDQGEQIKDMLDTYMYCLLDWEGLEDENGKPIPCTDKMKRYVFDHYASIREFVTTEIIKIMGVEDKELKN